MAYSRTQINSPTFKFGVMGWVLDVSDFRVRGLVLKLKFEIKSQNILADLLKKMSPSMLLNFFWWLSHISNGQKADISP